jgi:Anti-sigma-K factor rskA/Sigma-70, region 4
MGMGVGGGCDIAAGYPNDLQMATFEQLSDEQRAIIELVVQRGRSYDEIAEMLELSTARIRELAREALSDLSPASARRVDPEWRGQLADYLLGQQSGPEATATKGHLRRSEPARIWSLSLLDALDDLYEDGNRPEIPEGGGSRERTRDRPREREPRRRERERDTVRERERRGERERGSPLGAKREGGRLGAVRELLTSRRAIPAAAALLLALGLIWFFVLRGDDDDGDGGEKKADTPAENAAQPEIAGQLELRPVGGANATGFAFLGRSEERPVLIIQGKVPRVPETQAYEVWLYNSRNDATSLGAQRPDEQGNFSGAGPLPEDFSRYRFIDVSRESVEQADNRHSGRSVLRARVEDFAPVQGAQGGGAAPPGGAAPGGQAPAPGGTPTQPAP